jgi:hypothetical protein
VHILFYYYSIAVRVASRRDVLDELQSIAQQAIDRFSRFSNLQIRVANNQPPIPPDIIEIVDRSIQTIERYYQENTQQIHSPHTDQI